MNLRNKRENAYNTRIQATFSDNLFFASSSLPVCGTHLHCFCYCHWFFQLLRKTFFISISVCPRKGECVCKPLSQFIFLATRIIPFSISVYIGQGETLPTQHKSWQPVDFDLISVFQSSFPHFRPWHPHLLIDSQQHSWMQLLCHREFISDKSSMQHGCTFKAQALDLEIVLLPKPCISARQLIRLKWLLYQKLFL